MAARINKYVSETKNRVGTAQDVVSAMAYENGLPGTTCDSIRIDRDHLAKLISRMDPKMKTTMKNTFTTKFLEIRYGENAADSDSLHTTSANPGITWDKPKKLMQFMTQQTFKLDLAAFEKMDSTVILRKQLVSTSVEGAGEDSGQDLGSSQPASRSHSPQAPALAPEQQVRRIDDDGRDNDDGGVTRGSVSGGSAGSRYEQVIKADSIIRPEQLEQWSPTNSGADIGVRLAIKESDQAAPAIKNRWFVSQVIRAGSDGYEFKLCDPRYVDENQDSELEWELESGSLAEAKYAYIDRVSLDPTVGLDDRIEYPDTQPESQPETNRSRLEDGLVAADTSQTLADSQRPPLLGPENFKTTLVQVIASAPMQTAQVDWRKVGRESAARAATEVDEDDSDHDGDHDDEGDDDGDRTAGAAAASVGMRQCDDCTRWFNQSRLSLHVGHCKGAPQCKDILSRATRHLLLALQTSSTQICTRDTRSIKKYAPPTVYDPQNLPWPNHPGVVKTLPFNWAHREPQGQAYGALYIEEFKPIIRQMFEAGEADKRYKYSPPMMQEELLSKNSNRYDLPSIVEIQIFVSTISQAKKKSNVAEPSATVDEASAASASGCVAADAGTRGRKSVVQTHPVVVQSFRAEYDRRVQAGADTKPKAMFAWYATECTVVAEARPKSTSGLATLLTGWRRA